MAGINVFEPIAAKILDMSNAWSGVAGSLASAVLTPIALGASILVLWHGISILRGAGGANHLLDVFVKCLRAFLVVAIALGAGAYSSNVVGMIQELRSSLTGLFIVGATSSYSALDIAMDKVLESWDPVWNWGSENVSVIPNTNFSGVVAIVSWALMACAFWVYGAICTINLLVIDVSLALAFALGPIFIACFAFQATARFTDAWLGAVLKYVFTAVVVAAVTGLGIGILEQYAQRISSAKDSMQFVVGALSALGSSIVLGVLALRIPTLAADIVGGIGVAAFGVGLGRMPLAAAQAVVGKTVSTGSNAAAYVAGRAAASEPAQAIAKSSLGQRAIEAYTRTAGVTQAIAGSDGARAAFSVGRAAGTGVVTGRPVGKMHTPGQ